MKRVLSKYGAYIAHLTTLSEDPKVKAADRAKLLGYLREWTKAKYLLGCAVFCDLLKPCATYSKVMQSEELDVLKALTSLVKTLQRTNELASKSLREWSTVKNTVGKITTDGPPTYQGQELMKLPQAKSFFEDNYAEFSTSIISGIKSRRAWSNLDLMRNIKVMLATFGWEKLSKDNDVATL